MDAYFVASGVVSFLCAVVLTVIVLHRKVHEGVVVKLGLVMMIFSLVASTVHVLTWTQSWMALWTAGFTLRLGLLTVCAGMILRRRQKGSWTAALSDWGALK